MIAVFPAPGAPVMMNLLMLFPFQGTMRITYDIFRTFDLSFMLGGWYKQEEQDL
jgi:hypothetical protein